MVGRSREGRVGEVGWAGSGEQGLWNGARDVLRGDSDVAVWKLTVDILRLLPSCFLDSLVAHPRRPLYVFCRLDVQHCVPAGWP